MSTRRWRAAVAGRCGLDEAPSASSGTVGGHPLGAVARRLDGHKARCACCGTPGSCWRLSVEARADGRQTTLDLCEKCLRRDGAAWALRFEPVPFER